MMTRGSRPENGLSERMRPLNRSIGVGPCGGEYEPPDTQPLSYLSAAGGRQARAKSFEGESRWRAPVRSRSRTARFAYTVAVIGHTRLSCELRQRLLR